MQDPRFSEALIHQDHTVCGRRLLPFCAAHLAALRFAGSPLVAVEASARITEYDLLYALEICSSPIDEASFQPGALLRPRRRWGDGLRSIYWRFSPAGYEAALKSWLSYFADYVSLPLQMERIEAEGAARYQAGGGLTGPDVLARVCSVLKQYPITERRAWTMPWGLLVWMDEQGRELDGNGRPFIRPEDEAEIDAALEEAERRGAEIMRERQRKQRR